MKSSFAAPKRDREDDNEDKIEDSDEEDVKRDNEEAKKQKTESETSDVEEEEEELLSILVKKEPDCPSENINEVFAHERDCRIHTHPDPTKHGYFLDEKQMHLSVTGLKSFFFPPFDGEKIVKNMMKANGKNGVYIKPGSRYHMMTEPEIFACWDDAAGNGTNAHLCMETHLNQGTKRRMWLKANLTKSQQVEQFLRPHGPTGECYEDARKYAPNMLEVLDLLDEKGWKPYRTEWVVFNEFLDIGGSIDAVFYKDVGGKRKYMIIDWKTVFEEKKVTDVFGKAFYPLELQNSKLSTFKLQLNTYKHFLCSEYGLEDVSMMVVCFFENETYKCYPIEDINVAQCLKVYMNALEVEKIALTWYKTGKDTTGFLPAYSEPMSADLLEIKWDDFAVDETDIQENEDEVVEIEDEDEN